MFESLKPAAPDKIIELMGLFAADPRADKVDLGVGVYKDAEGRTPVMRAVKAAERRLLDEQGTKAYVGLLGDLEFVDAMAGLALGKAVPADRLSGAQTPGGTGAIRQLLELTRRPALLRERILAADETTLRSPVLIDEVQKVPAVLDEVHWLIENHGLRFYPTHEQRQLHMPPGAELLVLQLHALSGGDRFDNLVQWGAFAATVTQPPIREWSVPQYSAQKRRNRPTLVGRNHIDV